MSKKDDSCLVYTLKYKKVGLLPLDGSNNKTLSQAYIIPYCLTRNRKEEEVVLSPCFRRFQTQSKVFVQAWSFRVPTWCPASSHLPTKVYEPYSHVPFVHLTCSLLFPRFPVFFQMAFTLNTHCLVSTVHFIWFVFKYSFQLLPLQMLPFPI